MRKLEDILQRIPSEEEYFNLLHSLADPIDSGFNTFSNLAEALQNNFKPKDSSRTWALIDRTLVLIGFAFIEDGLKKSITHHFNPPLSTEAIKALFNEDASPFKNASAKILTAHQLGIIDDKERDDFSSIRKIRNVFAHAIVQLDLSEPEINETCMTLNFVKKQESPDFSLTKYPARKVLLFAIGFYVFKLKHYNPSQNKKPQA